jgi:hypothetical protein
MPSRNLESTYDDARAWGAQHVTLAFVIGAILGFVVHAQTF